jgi:hypothetical protein
MTTRRVYELEVGDVFKFSGQQYVVLEKRNGQLFYDNHPKRRGSHGEEKDHSFGEFSQARVEYVCRDEIKRRGKRGGRTKTTADKK